jgi:DNA-binding MarR family transcriptional regulator
MRVTDPQAIRALAHPLRLDLLEVLAAQGPATAAQCGRILGTPQANCSFHLRQLAKYGYVEEAEPGADRRERQWRLTTNGPAIRVDSTGNPRLRREVERVVVDREIDAIRAYTERDTDEDEAWQGSLGLLTALLAVSPAEAAQLRAQWRALLQPYLGRKPADHPDARHIRYFLAATPLEGAQQ